MKFYYRIHHIVTNAPMCAKIFPTRNDAHVYAEKNGIQIALNRSRMTGDIAVIVRY